MAPKKLNTSHRKIKTRAVDQNKMVQEYWDKRIKTPIFQTLLLNTFTVIVQYNGIKANRLEEEVTICKWLMLLSLLVYSLVVPSLFNKKYNWLVRYGFMICSVRLISYNYNLFQNKHILPQDEWIIYCQMQVLACLYMLHYHFHNFDHTQPGYHLFSLVQTNLIFFSATFSAGDSSIVLNLNGKRGFIFIALTFQAAVFVAQYLENEHNSNLMIIFDRFNNHDFLKVCIDNHTDSLVIVNDQNQITYSNPVFRRVFNKALRESVAREAEHRNSSSSISLDHPQLRRPSIFGSLKRKLKCLCNCSPLNCLKRICTSKPKESDQEQKVQSLFDQVNEGTSYESAASILKMKLFRQEADSQETSKAISTSAKAFQDFSILDILQEKEAKDGCTFKLLDPGIRTRISSRPNKNHDQSSMNETSLQSSIYIRTLFTTLVVDDHERTLMRIVDVTDTILIDKTQAQNELLALINATVSHELRNPLNSIVAQNVAKHSMYKEVNAILEKSLIQEKPLSIQQVQQVQQTLAQLHESLTIQDSSAKLMSFLVQDFLDYAQIKSGKFRINIKPFNIRNAVQNVMNIQKEKAQAQKLDFKAEFVGIAHDDRRKWSQFSKSKNRSPTIYCDEQRVMQVLLNIQSNALKFTQQGGVLIKVEIEEKEGDEYLKISVTDTGLGVPYEDQRKLFKLFGFVQSTVEVNRNGIGLGLVISEQIVKKFGGSISFTSVPSPEANHGSTFSFTFKLSSPPEKEEVNNPLAQLAKCEDNGKSINSKTLVYAWQPEDTELENLGVGVNLMSLGSALKLQEPSLIENSVSKMSTIRNEQQLTMAQATKNLNFMMHSYNRYTTQDDPPSEARSSEEKSYTWRGNVRSLSQLNARDIKIEIEETLEASEDKRILIVDDQIFNIRALKIILEYKFGVKASVCDHAFNGKEALDIIEEDIQNQRETGLDAKYPLILMDCNMPVMDGYEASNAIRQRYWEELGLSISRQPIISAVTGHTEPMHIQKCFKHGMNQVLSKPIDSECLEIAVVKAGFLSQQDAMAVMTQRIRQSIAKH